jgi:MFS transporter, DHA3 family, macrolide efflux protein
MKKENILPNPSKLMNRHFLLLWQGQAISHIGSQVSTIATLYWIKHATESPAVMGVMAMISGLAGVLFLPIGGAFADRYSRRLIIIICDLISGFAVLSLSLLMFFTPEAKGRTLAFIFAASVALAVAKSSFMPAISASVADIVPKERVASANSMLQASIQISTMLGQGVGGILFRMIGAPLLLLFDGVTYLFSAFSACFITIPQTLTEKQGGWRARAREFKREILDGLAYVRANTGLTQILLITTFFNFFMAPVQGLLPFFVEDRLKLHPDWFGYLLTAYGIGSLVGYLLAGTVTVSGKSRAGLISAFMFLLSVLYGLLGIVKTPMAVVLIVIGSGAVSGFINVNIVTLLQITTPSEIRGRVFGLVGTISACLLPIGAGLGGMAASLAEKNIALIYLACGACMLLITLVASTFSEFRNYLAFEPNASREATSLDQGIGKIISAD